jgi:hypothetical protein
MHFPEDQTLTNIERRLAALERSGRAGYTSIGEGGLTVKDGGNIQILDSSGNVLVTLDSTGLTIHET